MGMGNNSFKNIFKKFKIKFFKKFTQKHEKYSFYDYGTKEEYDEKEHLGVGLFKEVFKGNFSSPIQEILSDPNAKILDVGCGSGFWLTDMAADYPKPSYVGIDVAPMFPKSTIPNNIKFFQYNILEGLPFDDNTFDFVHIQFLTCDITVSQWENLVYQELARLLKPGGWLEVSDPDIEIKNCGPVNKRLNQAVCNHLISNNFSPTIGQRHHSFIKSIPSFSSSTVHHEEKVLYLGSYANKLGEVSAQHMIEVFRYTYMSPVGQKMNIKKEDIEPDLDTIRHEFELYKTYFYVHRFYARKD